MAKNIWICLLFFFFYLKFKKSFAILNQAEEAITFEFIKKYDIRSLILIEDSSFNLNDLNQFKILEKLKIPFLYLSGAKIFEYFSKESSFYVNILLVFKVSNINSVSTVLNDLLRNNQYGYFNMFKWILFAEHELTIAEEKLLHIPYDCLFLVVYTKDFNIYHLKEIYEVKGKIFSLNYGSWDNDKGLITKNDFIYTRRFDLNDTVLVIQTHSLQHCEFVKKARTCVNLQILMDYGQLLNIRYIWQPVSARDQGIIGDIFTLAAPYDSIAMTEPYDYLAPFFKVSLNWYIRKPVYREQSDYYIKPFGIKLWSCVLLCLLAGITFGIISYYAKKWRMIESTFVDLMFLTLDNMCNQDGSNGNEILSFKIAKFSLRFFSLFIISAYSGTILSYLAIRRLNIPFESLSGFIGNGQYVIATIPNSFPYTYFRDNNASLIKEIFENHFLVLENVTRALLVTKLCDELVAFAALDNDFDALRPWCGLYRVKEPISYVFSSVRALEHSPFVKVFDYLFLRFYSSGIHEKLKAFVQGEGIATLEEESTFSSVPVSQMVQVLSMGPIGIIIAVIVLLCEMIYASFRKPRQQNKKINNSNRTNKAITRRNCRIATHFHISLGRVSSTSAR